MTVPHLTNCPEVIQQQGIGPIGTLLCSEACRQARARLSSVTCEFCRLAERLKPGDIRYEDALAIAFAPLNPATDGHTLVIPKAHVVDITECSAPLAAGLALSVREVVRSLKWTLQPQGMNVITSAGPAATQTVFHLHWHVVPRYTDPAKDRMPPIWPHLVQQENEKPASEREASRERYGETLHLLHDADSYVSLCRHRHPNDDEAERELDEYLRRLQRITRPRS